MSPALRRACTLFVFPLLVLLSSCSHPPQVKLPGYLYMGVGPHIVRLNLTTHQIKTLFTLPSHLQVDILSKISDQKLLVSTYPIHMIGTLNLKTRHWTLLRTGWKAIAFPKVGIFVFYDASKPGFYAQELYWALIRHPAQRYLIDPGPFPLQMPVVPTGRNRFVYTSWRKKHVQRLWSYNLGHARFHALPIKDAYPELNLGNHTLLCTQISVSTHPYFLYFMRGETASMRTLPLESWYTAVKYIQGLHTLLVGRASSSLFVSAIHRWTLYQYDLQSGAMKPLTGKTEVGLDSVVWLRHRP